MWIIFSDYKYLLYRVRRRSRCPPCTYARRRELLSYQSTYAGRGKCCVSKRKRSLNVVCKRIPDNQTRASQRWYILFLTPEAVNRFFSQRGVFLSLFYAARKSPLPRTHRSPACSACPLASWQQSPTLPSFSPLWRLSPTVAVALDCLPPM